MCVSKGSCVRKMGSLVETKKVANFGGCEVR